MGCWFRKQIVILTHSIIVICVQDEETVEDVCKQIIKQWAECRSRATAKSDSGDGIYFTWILLI